MSNSTTVRVAKKGRAYVVEQLSLETRRFEAICRCDSRGQAQVIRDALRLQRESLWELGRHRGLQHIVAVHQIPDPVPGDGGYLRSDGTPFRITGKGHMKLSCPSGSVRVESPDLNDPEYVWTRVGGYSVGQDARR